MYLSRKILALIGVALALTALGCAPTSGGPLLIFRPDVTTTTARLGAEFSGGPLTDTTFLYKEGAGPSGPSGTLPAACPLASELTLDGGVYKSPGWVSVAGDPAAGSGLSYSNALASGLRAETHYTVCVAARSGDEIVLGERPMADLDLDGTQIDRQPVLFRTLSLPTPTPVVNATPNATSTPASIATPSGTQAAAPTATATVVAIPNPAPPPTVEPTPEPTPVPTPEPTPVPTPVATAVPTAAPTPPPTASPTPSPTAAPTATPTPQVVDDEPQESW